jgi:hypothetical protein
VNLGLRGSTARQAKRALEMTVAQRCCAGKAWPPVMWNTPAHTRPVTEPGNDHAPPRQWSSRITSWLSGAAKPPLLLRLYLGLVLGASSLGLFGRRELVVAVAALLFYGGSGISVLFFWESTLGWFRIHAFADRLLFIPLLFLALAYVTTIPSVICLAISVCVGLPFATVTYMVWRRRTTSTSDR